MSDAEVAERFYAALHSFDAEALLVILADVFVGPVAAGMRGCRRHLPDRAGDAQKGVGTDPPRLRRDAQSGRAPYSVVTPDSVSRRPARSGLSD